MADNESAGMGYYPLSYIVVSVPPSHGKETHNALFSAIVASLEIGEHGGCISISRECGGQSALMDVSVWSYVREHIDRVFSPCNKPDAIKQPVRVAYATSFHVDSNGTIFTVRENCNGCDSLEVSNETHSGCKVTREEWPLLRTCIDTLMALVIESQKQ